MAKECITCCSVICVAVSFVLFIILLLNLDNLHNSNYEESICKISDVEYPTNFSSFDSNLWVDCDCGKKCISKSPCVRLYTNESEKYILDEFPTDENNECTFSLKECNNGENPQNQIDLLYYYISVSESYINKTVTCYINEKKPDIIYLKLDDFLKNIEIASIICGVLIFISIISLIIGVNDEAKKNADLADLCCLRYLACNKPINKKKKSGKVFQQLEHL